ncbi:hypothetical protein V6Z11_D13G011900 [Gossypium hirsutum]
MKVQKQKKKKEFCQLVPFFFCYCSLTLKIICLSTYFRIPVSSSILELSSSLLSPMAMFKSRETDGFFSCSISGSLISSGSLQFSLFLEEQALDNELKLSQLKMTMASITGTVTPSETVTFPVSIACLMLFIEQ